jgi:hypothetical protein
MAYIGTMCDAYIYNACVLIVYGMKLNCICDE